MAEKIIRFGIIGPGRIATKFAEAVSICDDAVVGAVASRDAERGADFAAKFGIATVYTSYEEIVKDPAIDAIYIAVPHNYHLENVLAALRNKKAVLCEKPCGVNLAQVQQMVETAREEQVLFVEAMWTRFVPTTLKAHEWIAAGKIGEVRLLESSVGLNVPMDAQNRLYNRDLAGGAILDIGVYPISFSLDFGKGALEQCTGMAQVGVTGVDEMVTLQMQFEDGVLALNSFGFNAKTWVGYRIYGTKGSIKLPDFYPVPEVLCYDNTGTLIDTYCAENTEGFYYQIEHFAKLWREGAIESPRMTWSESIRMAEIYGGMMHKWGIAYE